MQKLVMSYFYIILTLDKLTKLFFYPGLWKIIILYFSAICINYSTDNILLHKLQYKSFSVKIISRHCTYFIPVYKSNHPTVLF